MKKILVPATIAGMAALALTSCKNDGFKKTKDGLEYKIVKDAPGDQHPDLGDVVSVHLRVRDGDSVLLESRKLNNNMPFEFPLTASPFKGDVSEGIKLMTPGDSAVFRVPLDSLLKIGNQKLPWMKPGDKMTYEVTLVSVKNKTQVQEEMKQQQEAMKKQEDEMLKQASAQMETDDKKLQTYFKAHGISNPSKTESGVYYVVTAPGNGDQLQPGQKVSMKYTGRTLDGQPFDSNVDPQFQHTEPFNFVLGQRQVIRGWDEGVAQLRKGSKATLYIPSPLAYGPQAQGDRLPANSVLIFDVEVLDAQ